MIVEQILVEKEQIGVVSIKPTGCVREAAQKMRTHEIGALLVIDSRKKKFGLVTERDILHAIATSSVDIGAWPVSQIMTKDVITCTRTDHAVRMLRLMNDRHIRHLPVLDNGQPIAMLSIRDFDYACRELEHHALTDDLTQISNRRSFDQQLKKELGRFRRSSAPLTVAVADIDHFKQVNDTYGHEAGDLVLREFSDLMVRELRTSDIVGRLGGEEFGFAFPGTDLKTAKLVCERLIKVTRDSSIVHSGQPIEITVSFGLVAADETSLTAQQILARADKMLYCAKSNGRDRVVADNPHIRATADDETESDFTFEC